MPRAVQSPSRHAPCPAQPSPRPTSWFPAAGHRLPAVRRLHRHRRGRGRRALPAVRRHRQGHVHRLLLHRQDAGHGARPAHRPIQHRHLRTSGLGCRLRRASVGCGAWGFGVSHLSEEGQEGPPLRLFWSSCWAWDGCGGASGFGALQRRRCGLAHCAARSRPCALYFIALFLGRYQLQGIFALCKPGRCRFSFPLVWG